MHVDQSSFAEPFTLDYFEKILIAPASYNIVAVMDESRSDSGCNRIGGYLCGAIRSNRMTILSIAVSPSYRRAGIGRHLMQSSIHASIQARLSSIKLHCNASNIAAQNLYTSIGFKSSFWVKNYYSKNVDAIYITF